MKYIQPYFYLAGATLIPWIALAHGGEEDGHPDEPVNVAHPENRMIVLAVVVVVFLAMGAFVWWSKKKNAPNLSPESTPTVPPKQ